MPISRTALVTENDYLQKQREYINEAFSKMQTWPALGDQPG